LVVYLTLTLTFTFFQIIFSLAGEVIRRGRKEETSPQPLPLKRDDQFRIS
jgi:hypothetical protein